MNIIYTVEKKIKIKCSNSWWHGNIERRYYQKFHHFISSPFFENFAPPFTQIQLRHWQV